MPAAVRNAAPGIEIPSKGRSKSFDVGPAPRPELQLRKALRGAGGTKGVHAFIDR